MYKTEFHRVALCLALVTGCVFSISSEKNKVDSTSELNPVERVNSTTLQHYQIIKRMIRSVPRRNCNTWSQWINDNHPSFSNKTDTEFVPLKTRNSFCPVAVGGNISKFECKDDKGEAFHGNKTLRGLKGQFYILCYDINMGVKCIALNATKDHCPDMSLRYYCSCPTSTGVTTTSTLASAKGKENTTVTKNETERKEGFPLLWWIVVAVTVALLFLYNTCLAVCLYKKAMRKIEAKDRITAVHPL